MRFVILCSVAVRIECRARRSAICHAVACGGDGAHSYRSEWTVVNGARCETDAPHDAAPTPLLDATFLYELAQNRLQLLLSNRFGGEGI